jgi:polysaccharide export outer membrane protein
MKKITSFVLLFCLCCVFLIPASASEYVLAPNDQLEIKIIGQSDLDTKQTIAPDGSISLPLIGRILAGGKTMF